LGKKEKQVAYLKPVPGKIFHGRKKEASDVLTRNYL
jgi:hypothetical protein